jgi:hypothetical protein
LEAGRWVKAKLIAGK